MSDRAKPSLESRLAKAIERRLKTLVDERGTLGQWEPYPLVTWLQPVIKRTLNPRKRKATRK